MHLLLARKDGQVDRVGLSGASGRGESSSESSGSGEEGRGRERGWVGGSDEGRRRRLERFFRTRSRRIRSLVGRIARLRRETAQREELVGRRELRDRRRREHDVRRRTIRDRPELSNRRGRAPSVSAQGFQLHASDSLRVLTASRCAAVSRRANSSYRSRVGPVASRGRAASTAGTEPAELARDREIQLAGLLTVAWGR